MDTGFQHLFHAYVSHGDLLKEKRVCLPH
jgi:hypothetical protein